MRRSSECCLVLLTHIASYFLLVWLFADGTVHSFFLVMAFLCVLFFLFYFLGGNCVFFSTVCDCYTRGRQYTRWLNVVCWCLGFVVPQYGANVMSLFWHLEF